MVHEIKDNLNEETCTVQMDFAENVVSTHGEEIRLLQRKFCHTASNCGALQEERSGCRQ